VSPFGSTMTARSPPPWARKTRDIPARAARRLPGATLRAAQPEAAPRGEQSSRSRLRRLRLTATAWPSSTPPMDPPEETRELPDVTIRAQETSPGFFVASYQPTSPETHPARQGFSIDTKRGLRGKNLAKVLDFAEAYWRQNYPDT
jgi:hypothetical protein